MAISYDVFRKIHSNLLLLLIVFAAMVQTLQYSSEEIKNACGPNKITLSSIYPEHVFAFPADGVDDATTFHLSGQSLANASVHSLTNHSTTINFTNEDGYFYRCQWVITTDSNHAISAIFDFSSGDRYTLSAEDDFGFIDNCTTKHCLIESSTPALSLEFHTKQFHAEPLTRFSAKLYSTSIAYEEKHPLIHWWIVLGISSTIIFIFVLVSYFFYMKRNLLLTRIFRLLNSSDASSKSAQAKKKTQLANGTQTSTGQCRRQHRTSVSLTHAPHFEPMPTIAEEDNEVTECESSTVSYLDRNSVRLHPYTSMIRVL